MGEVAPWDMLLQGLMCLCVCGQELPSLTTLVPGPSSLNPSLGISRQKSVFGQSFPSVLHTRDPCLSPGK